MGARATMSRRKPIALPALVVIRDRDPVKCVREVMDLAMTLMVETDLLGPL